MWAEPRMIKITAERERPENQNAAWVFWVEEKNREAVGLILTEYLIFMDLNGLKVEVDSVTDLETGDTPIISITLSGNQNMAVEQMLHRSKKLGPLVSRDRPLDEPEPETKAA